MCVLNKDFHCIAVRHCKSPLCLADQHVAALHVATNSPVLICNSQSVNQPISASFADLAALRVVLSGHIDAQYVLFGVSLVPLCALSWDLILTGKGH